MSQFEIVNYTPIPRQVSTRKGETKYPFDHLEVGKNTLKCKAKYHTVRAAIRKYQTNHEGTRFTARNLGNGYTMVWRIK